jgi:hypothetical protein
MKTLVLLVAFFSGAAAAFMIRYELNAGAMAERQTLFPPSWREFGEQLGEESMALTAPLTAPPASERKPLLSRPLFKNSPSFENRRSRAGGMQPPRTTFGY